MSVSLPNGSTVSLASTYLAAKTVTAISNASPASVSATAHGFLAGDIIELTSGWSKLTNRLFRVASATTDAFTLEGVDTTDTVVFPAAGGAGSARKISAWTQIQQILEFGTSGGEQQFTTYAFLESDTEQQIPTQKSAQSITMSIADDPTLAGYIALAAADESRTVRGLRVNLPKGSSIYYNGYPTLNRTPSLTRNEVMACEATYSLVGGVTRYAA